MSGIVCEVRGWLCDGVVCMMWEEYTADEFISRYCDRCAVFRLVVLDSGNVIAAQYVNQGLADGLTDR